MNCARLVPIIELYYTDRNNEDTLYDTVVCMAEIVNQNI